MVLILESKAENKFALQEMISLILEISMQIAMATPWVLHDWYYLNSAHT